MAAAPNELSFLPDDYLERKARRRTNAICAVLFCVVISAIGGAFTVSERSMRDLNKEYGAVQVQYTDAAKRIEQVQKMQEKQRTMAHQAELTAGLLEKVPRSNILAEITNDIPKGMSLIDFDMSSKLMTSARPAPKTAFEIRKAQMKGTVAGIPVAQPRVYDVSMKLTGVARTDLQVSAFLAKLNTSPMFEDVNLLVTEEWKDPQANDKDQKLRKFELEMKLDPNYTPESSTTADASPDAPAPGNTRTASLDNK